MRNIKDKLCIMMPLKMRKYIEKYSHLFIGYKTKNIKKRFATSIEKNINGKKKFVFSLLENEIEFIEDKDTWVTPSFPLIVFIFIGYIISILYGDIPKNIF
jgi:hypothetical protein